MSNKKLRILNMILRVHRSVSFTFSLQKKQRVIEKKICARKEIKHLAPAGIIV